MKFGCIGEKLGHSFSVEIHEKIGLYSYELWPLEKEKLSHFMKRADFDGINVTIPYKKDVIPYLSALSPEAKLCGAVNTVVKREGKLYGYNTDFLGMKDLLSFGHLSVKGKNVLILGSGGTSRTALCLCESLGAKRVHRVSRSGKDGCLTYEKARELSDTEILINTTPCGMYPKAGESPVDLSFFPRLEGVADAIYNPQKTRLLMDAEASGIPCVGGLYMLVSQALYAAEIFTGITGLCARARGIYEEIKREKENIVLIGMPGSGKSTLGRDLAERLGKEFFDSDTVIEEEEKRTIPEIFAAEGEKAFRDAESRVIRSLSALRGKVIATGGGAVLREENVSFLKSNGRLIFLDAPLSDLTATASRPLSSTPADLEKRHKERYEIYLAVCDERVSVSRNRKENLDLIQKVLG